VRVFAHARVLSDEENLKVLQKNNRTTCRLVPMKINKYEYVLLAGQPGART